MKKFIEPMIEKLNFEENVLTESIQQGDMEGNFPNKTNDITNI